MTMNYVHARGINEDTSREHNLFYYDGSKFYSYNDNVEVYRSVKYFTREDFKNSIVFPIFDLHGEVVGVTTRYVGKPPEGYCKFNGSTFVKKNIVYGLDKTYKDIVDKDSVYITEGPFDFLSAYQAGVKNCVSSLGANLMFNQFCLLNRFTNNFVLLYDNDPAGNKGAEEAGELITKFGGTYRIVKLECDPDEYIQNKGAKEFLQCIA